MADEAIRDPCESRVMEDIESADFQSGLKEGRWRIERFEFPFLYFAISATEPDGSDSEYGFRGEISGFSAQAPEVRIWDLEADTPLPQRQRPKGGKRLEDAFKDWGSHTVYRPWDRQTGPHNNNARDHPQLAWHSERRLTFIFEDLYGILNSNARAHRARA